MKKPCKECPWVVRNNHNDTIVKFSIKNNLQHNCHMNKNGVKNLWDFNKKYACIGVISHKKSLNL